jgi:hypothetical protein
VQLFDSHESAAQAAAAFVAEGFADGERVVLVIRLDDWSRAAVRLAAEGIPLGEAIGSGRLVVRDSTRTVEGCLIDGMPTAGNFERAVGDLVRDLASAGVRLRAYGDMVDLLAAEERFDAAARLEELWNDLRARVPFTLFCGYSSTHFCRAGDDALCRIRGLHSHERREPGDLVANHLLEPTGA